MGAVVMDFVSSCGCDGAYGRDSGFVWVAWFFFWWWILWPIVSVVVIGFVVAGSGWTAKKRKRCSRHGGQRRER